MGTCFVNNNDKKPITRANPAINQQINIAVTPTTPQSAISIQTRHLQNNNDKVLKQKQLNLNQ